MEIFSYTTVVAKGVAGSVGARLGALPDDEVQEFLEGPETGLVCLKEVEVLKSLQIAQ
jgi:hypothetical protein